MNDYEVILKFWFQRDDLNSLNSLNSHEEHLDWSLWFITKKETDDLIKEKFEYMLDPAFNGEYDHWKNEPQGYVALIILLDQFPRNIYRGSVKMFAYDSKALAIAKEFINDKKKFNQVSIIEQLFMYLCLVHSENPDDVLIAVEADEIIYKNNTSKMLAEHTKLFYESAKRHYGVLKQFGRYPHRNEFFGRVSTSEEIEYLNTSDHDFVKMVKKIDK